MTKKFINILLVLTIVFGFNISKSDNFGVEKAKATSAREYYVSPNGSNSWSGLLAEPNADKTDGPLATINGAQFKIREYKNHTLDEKGQPIVNSTLDMPIEVNIKSGNYYLKNTLAFTSADSGTADFPITYRGEGAGVNLLGVTEISNAQTWTSCDASDTLCNGLPADSQDKVYHTNLGPDKNFNSLFIDGERATRARTPNEGIFYNVVPPSTAPDPNSPIVRDGFLFKPGDIDPSWRTFRNDKYANDVEVVALERWQSLRYKLDKVVDNKAFIQCDIPCVVPSGDYNAFDAAFGFGGNSRYYLDNVFEGLDSPGEWYLNKSTNDPNKPTGELFYYLKDDQKINDIKLIVPNKQTILSILGDITRDPILGDSIHYVSNLRFDHLNFAYTDWGGFKADGTSLFGPSAIALTYTNHIDFINNIISHTGAYAFSAYTGTSDLIIDRNEIYDTGGHGIIISGGSASNITITNNKIHDIGSITPSASAVAAVDASNSTISNNEIYNSNYGGISVTIGTRGLIAENNKIANNHIHHIGLLLEDLGGIWLNGLPNADSVMCGPDKCPPVNNSNGNFKDTVIENNLIHDIKPPSLDSPLIGFNGIYLDDESSGITVRNNVVFDNGTNLYLHSNGDNTIENNIFANASQSQLRYNNDYAVTAENNIIKNNIIYNIYNTYLDRKLFTGSSVGTDYVYKRLTENNNLYYDKYNNYTSAFYNPDLIPSSKYFSNLDYFITAPGQDANSKIEDPLFVDASAFDPAKANETDPLTRNYSLKSSSPAFSSEYKIGFKAIDLSKVGVTKSAFTLTADSKPAFSISADKTSVATGGIIKFTVQVTNQNTSLFTNIDVTSRIPAGTEFVSAENGGVVVDGEVKWPQLPQLLPNGTFSATYQVRVN